jgi:hypothetical protein
MVHDLQRERESVIFAVLQPDGSITRYSPADLDGLSQSDRDRLFGARPEMKLFWYGKPNGDAPWNAFRFRGGKWVTRDAVGRYSEAEKSELMKRNPEFVEWYAPDAPV